MRAATEKQLAELGIFYDQLIMGMGGGHIPVIIPENYRLRRLTEIECERLQGFPDNWTEGISSTHRYKCLGNAVTVNVVYELARNL
jgi:site-specific DNA-cytosine methylase